MQTAERYKAKPTLVAERRAATAETKVHMTLRDVERLTAELAEMRGDRDRWRAQAERLATALERLKTVPVPAVPAPVQVLTSAPTGDADDVLHGMTAIAEAFGLNRRQAEHLKIEHGLPTFKVGKTVCARRGAVAAWFATQEGR
jgi:hypothetical protein